jgi:hypothetical protein
LRSFSDLEGFDLLKEGTEETFEVLGNLKGFDFLTEGTEETFEVFGNLKGCFILRGF